MKILIPFWIPLEVADKIDNEFELIYPKEKVAGLMSVDEIKIILPEVDGIMAGSEPFGKQIIDIGKNLKVIGRMGVGYDNVDFKYAGSKGIGVINTPIAVQQSTAELTVAIMLAVARCVVSLDKKVREEKKIKHIPMFDKSATTLYGKTLGIIGFGRIGKAVGIKCNGLGMKVIYSDIIPAPKEFEDSIGATRFSTEELLKTADFVTIHCPYFPENYHLINRDTLVMMKPTAYLINASRGKMVDEQSLVDALKAGTIAGAALDVYEFEPEINPGLLELDNVVLVPHVGTWNYDTRVEMALESLEGMCRFLKGEIPINCVNKEYLK
jgi:lactate dehydrogenase-like 2-hydroxyacid dehydrogenase